MLSEHPLQTQHVAWLVEEFHNLRRIAAAVTRRHTLADEALSNSVLSILQQIANDTVHAKCKAQFCAWMHTIVRVQSKRVLGFVGTGEERTKRFIGDVAVDRAAARIREHDRPDRRQIRPKRYEADDWIAKAHDRSETV